VKGCTNVLSVEECAEVTGLIALYTVDSEQKMID